MRAAWTCLIGIILAVALNKCTEYYTGTEYQPVKSLAKSCETGHATNIIQGFAVGYESSVAAVLIIAAAILASVLVFYRHQSDVRRLRRGHGRHRHAHAHRQHDLDGRVRPRGRQRQRHRRNGLRQGSDGRSEVQGSPANLADLDAVGNTTKAITKGIAIGSAVIAAVSLFNSFIVSVGSGGKGENEHDHAIRSTTIVANQLTLSDPRLFIGLLIGGAVPFLFSSMTIRAVGRAAFLIVKECRIQFRDKEIWAGTKKPDYGRVVDICTGAAQKELDRAGAAGACWCRSWSASAWASWRWPGSWAA